MGIWISKPLNFANGTFLGGVATYSSDDLGNSSNDTASAVNSDILNATGSRASIGWSSDQVSETDWAGSDNGYGLWTIKVSGIDSNLSPTLSQVNQLQLVTDVLHGSASGSINGTQWGTNTTGYTIDTSSHTITTADGTIISYSSLSTSFTQISSQMTNLRSQSSSNTWYYNGIQFGSQAAQQTDSTSGNETYDTDFWAVSNPPSASMASLISNIDITNIPLNTEDIARSDVMFVEKILRDDTAVSDELKMVLSYLLAYTKTNQAETKKLRKTFNKVRSSMNITSLETLENTYRKG